MKIKIITCHDVYNHGASLQAYALQTYLESLGHDVEIIDYKPPYLSGHYNLWAVCNPAYNKPILKQAYLLAKLPGRLCSLRRKKAFDMFTQRYLKLTRRYDSYEELESDIPEADVYIAGSDQIWNTLFQNGRDKAFYLAFAPKDKLKISYAASFSTPDVQDKYRPFVSRMLKGLERISLRERSSLSLAAELGRDDAVAVCDPVFLLKRTQWESLITNTPIYDSDYLLIYDTENSDKIRKMAEALKRVHKMPIYDVSAFRHRYADKHFNNVGPLDFVRLIRNANHVISNSLHATVFSIIFEKDFYVTDRSEDINIRMQCLLEAYGLAERFITSESPCLPSEPIDYKNVQSLLNEDISFSKDYLAFQA